MNKHVIVLDSGPLGLLCGPKTKKEHDDIRTWVDQWDEFDAVMVIPQIIDYELRRELLRMRSASKISRLEYLNKRFSKAWLSADVLERAAYLWAKARWEGWPTADSSRLDIDCLFAAQAESVAWEGDRLVVATSNVQHIRRYGLDAHPWRDIVPQ